jgi:hypothetical protein
MTVGQKEIQVGGVTWYCVSIFYARSSSAALLAAIDSLFEANGNLFDHWSLYFSQTQGECIKLVFIPKEDSAEIAPVLIEEYFEGFLNDNPSSEVRYNPYNTALWTPYPNNTLVWNASYIPPFLFGGEDVRRFSQITSLLIARLYDEESSYEENAESIATFLRVQIAKKQNVSFPEIANRDIAETILSYWDYEADELLTEWLQYVEITSAPIIVQCHLDYWTENPFGFLHGDIE